MTRFMVKTPDGQFFDCDTKVTVLPEIVFGGPDEDAGPLEGSHTTVDSQVTYWYPEGELRGWAWVTNAWAVGRLIPGEVWTIYNGMKLDRLNARLRARFER